MRNVRVRVAYDGALFFGWQRQAGFLSVQEELEDAVEGVTGERVTVYGAGRTDTGVHAFAQVANFHIQSPISDFRLRGALNAHAQPGLSIRDVETCSDDFHAQRAACGKRYLYVIKRSPVRPPMGRQYIHWEPRALDFNAMRAAAAHLVGEHDFSAFASAGSPRLNNVRRVSALKLRRKRETIWFVIQGNGFLYNMVRAIAGTLIDVGRGRFAADEIPAMLAAGNRDRAGPTAPASGLYLVRVLYPGTPPFLRCHETPGRLAPRT